MHYSLSSRNISCTSIKHYPWCYDKSSQDKVLSVELKTERKSNENRYKHIFLEEIHWKKKKKYTGPRTEEVDSTDKRHLNSVSAAREGFPAGTPPMPIS